MTIIGYNGDAMEPFVSRDGIYLFFNNNGANKDIFYAASGVIVANVNTAAGLEYAPAISADGRELFFTRLNLSAMQARIYRSTRTSSTATFATPQLVSAISGFAEGPALSPAEKSLSYHRENAANGRFEIYRVTRP